MLLRLFNTYSVLRTLNIKLFFLKCTIQIQVFLYILNFIIVEQYTCHVSVRGYCTVFGLVYVDTFLLHFFGFTGIEWFHSFTEFFPIWRRVVSLQPKSYHFPETIGRLVMIVCLDSLQFTIGNLK